jgi:lipopolysaccharide transport system ATP-binding protein
MKPILEIENVSKKFIINSEQQPYLSLRETILSVFKRSRPGQEFWALRDVNFEINPGESFGVIGGNGAGKSTLLKILSRITPPSTGNITCRGRVASLLEVGTGFHSELSGRENVFMNGSILGMKRQEIQRNFDAIVDFAGVEKFIDTPLKFYSSGMQLRLAFAVAAFLENEILIIDEVLAVGDAEFQKKCLGKMEAVSKSGRTVLFVSHNMTAVRNLCNKALILKKGQVHAMGKASQIVDQYLQVGMARNQEKWAEADAPGNDLVKLLEVKVSSEGNEPDGLFIEKQTNIYFRLRITNMARISGKINLSMMLNSRDDITVFNVATESKTLDSEYIEASCHIPAELLNDEQYSIRLLVVENSTNPLTDMRDILSFKMEERSRNTSWHGKWEGVVRPQNLVRWTY